MPQIRKIDRKPLSPAVFTFAVAAFICASLLMIPYCFIVYREVAKQQAFLAAHGDANSYLVPVYCGETPKGTDEIDYFRGFGALLSNSRRSKPVCWYSPSTYDRLFAGRFSNTGLAAHRAQAAETNVDLLVPSFSHTFMIAVGFLTSAAVGLILLSTRVRQT